MIRLWILATKMSECTHEYSLEDCIWDWIELSNKKEKVHVVRTEQAPR